MASIIQIRRDTLANWTTNNPVLASGEMGYEADTKKMRIGDGVTAFLSLPIWLEANGQGIQKNYLHNTGNLINQRGYVFGTSVTTIGQRLTDRWLANANPSSISYSTPADPELMTIVGGIYQGIELNDLLGKVCVLHWEGTSQASVFRSNGDLSDFKNSPLIFTMPTDANTAGAMEYVTFGAGTLKHMKLEVGEVPTKWEPEEIATQMSICKRYFERIGSVTSQFIGSGYIQNAGQGRVYISYEHKRAVPSIAINSLILSSSGVDGTVTSLGTVNLGYASARLLVNSGGTHVAGQGAGLITASGGYAEINADII